MQPMIVPVTEPAAHAPRQSNSWLVFAVRPLRARFVRTTLLVITFAAIFTASAVAVAEPDIVLTMPVPDDPKLCFPNDESLITVSGGRVSAIQLPKNRKIAFADGVVPIRVKSKWGYMDTKRRITIPPKFDDAHPFSQGRAVVMVGQRYGYINRAGNYIAEPQFSWGFDFYRGVASVRSGGRWGLINRDGQWVVQPRFKRLDLLAGGLFAETFSGEQGFIDTRGAFIRSGRHGGSYQPAK